MTKYWLLFGCIFCPAVGTYLLRVFAAESPDLETVMRYDIGTVFVGVDAQTVGHRFQIRNPSRTESLVLRMASKSCSCLVLEAKDVVEVPAGASIEIPLSSDVKSERRVQERRWHVDYDTNRDDVRRMRLEFSALVIPRVTVEMPPDAVLPVRPGAVKEFPFTVTLRGPAGDVLPQCRIAATGENFSFRETARRTFQHKVYDTLAIDCLARIECASDVGVGERFSGALVVEAGSETHQERITWTRGSRIDVFPRSLLFAADRSESTILLRGPVPFAVSDVEVSDGLLDVEFDPALQSAQVSVKIRLKDDAAMLAELPRRVFRGEIRIRATCEPEGVFVVPFVVVGRQVAAMPTSGPVSRESSNQFMRD